MSNTSCPIGKVDTLQSILSASINYVVIPGNNTADPSMVVCCSPNSVSLYNSCNEWCSLPLQFLDQTHSNSDEIGSEFLSCSTANGKRSQDVRALFVHLHNSAAMRPQGSRGLFLLALLAVATMSL